MEVPSSLIVVQVKVSVMTLSGGTFLFREVWCNETVLSVISVRGDYSPLVGILRQYDCRKRGSVEIFNEP